MRYRWIYWTSFVLGLEVFLSKHLSSNLNKCTSSIPNFLASSATSTLAQTLLVGLSLLLNKQRNSHNKLIDFLFFVMLPIYSVYVAVIGIIYIVNSSQYTPDCFNDGQVVIYTWTGAFTLNGLFFILVILRTIYQKIKPPRRGGYQRLVDQPADNQVAFDPTLLQQLLDLQNINNALNNLNNTAVNVNNDGGQNNQGPGRGQNAGLSEEDIEELPVRRYTATFTNRVQYRQTNCTICLGDFEASDEVTQLKNCNHVFHSECIRTWLNRSKICPVCRVNV